MSDQELSELIELLTHRGIRGSNAEIEAALRFAESQGWTITKPAAK